MIYANSIRYYVNDAGYYVNYEGSAVAVFLYLPSASST